MDLVGQPPSSSSQIVHGAQDIGDELDLVGGPFAVIESDPGVFTSLTRKLGVKNIELVEVYDIEPWAVDNLSPHGLIFCFLWRKDARRPADFDDPAADRVWFANQLSDDACASHAILNVLLNCPHVDVGDELRIFRKETEGMSPVMKGLAVTNSRVLRKVHNSLARPPDIRGALNSIAITTLEAAAKAKAKPKPETTSTITSKHGTKPPPAKRPRTNKSPSTNKKGKGKEKAMLETEDGEEAYHFIGYVPAYGKVWEVDGLKSGPLEVGELPLSPSISENVPMGAPSQQDHQAASSKWMDVARPALRMKMKKYGGAAEGGSNIRFSLLAIVDGVYEKASDELVMLKRERLGLEKRMGVGWEEKVDPALLASSRSIFDKPSPGTGQTFATDFGARRLEQDMRILDMPEGNVVPAWEACVRNAVRANVAVEDELTKAISANTDHIKRAFDYEPFLKRFIERLNAEGLLKPILDLDGDEKVKGRARVVSRAAKERRGTKGKW